MKLSIIVPIYNVESYLRKCVDSLLNQDIGNYEIILVDDGSTDGCPAICDEYSEKAKSEELRGERVYVRVIHQDNAGLSAARNSGIEVAQGEYIMFVDSDDYIEPNVLGGLLANVERDHLDVLRFRFQNVNENYEVFNPYKYDHSKDNDYSEEVTDGVSFLNQRMGTQCYVTQFIIRWDLLIKSEEAREKSEDCLFTPGIYFEDTDWTPRMLCRAKRVASANTIVYNYLMRTGSITNAVEYSKKKKVLDDKMHLIATLQQQAIDLKKSGRYNRWYADMISDTVVSVIGILSGDFYKEKEKYLDNLRQLKLYPIKPRTLKARLINLSPKLAVELLHFKNH